MTVSITKTETAAGVMVAQDTLYFYRMMKSLALQVKLPMILEMNNLGAIDIVDSWIVDGRTHHVDIHNSFLRELKDQGFLLVKHIAGDINDSIHSPRM